MGFSVSKIKSVSFKASSGNGATPPDGNGIFSAVNNNRVVPNGFVANLSDSLRFNGRIGINVSPAIGIAYHINGNTRVDGSLIVNHTTLGSVFTGTGTIKFGIGNGTNTAGQFAIETIGYSGATSKILRGYAFDNNVKWQIDNYLRGARLFLNTTTGTPHTKFSSVVRDSSYTYSRLTIGLNSSLLGTLAVNALNQVDIKGYSSSQEVFSLGTGVAGNEAARGILSLKYGATGVTLAHITALNTAGGDVDTNFRNRSYLFNGLSIGYNSTTITTSTPDVLLDVKGGVVINSTTQGFLPPRMTTVQMNAIASPAKGLLIYDITTNNWKGNKGTPAIPNWSIIA